MAYSSSKELDLAHAIFEAKGGETYRRAAVSRAYFACFSESRLQGFEAGSKSRNHHAQVIAAVSAHGLYDIAFSLRQMKKMRERADYDHSQPFQPSDALEGLHQAQNLHRALRTLARGRR